MKSGIWDHENYPILEYAKSKKMNLGTWNNVILKFELGKLHRHVGSPCNQVIEFDRFPLTLWTVELLAIGISAWWQHRGISLTVCTAREALGLRSVDLWPSNVTVSARVGKAAAPGCLPWNLKLKAPCSDLHGRMSIIHPAWESSRDRHYIESRSWQPYRPIVLSALN